MKLNDLKPAPGSKKSRRRVGRGLGSGRGKTAGRGQKGQKSRSGFSQGAGWEGGKSRLIMRLPKRGFNKLKEEYQVVNLGRLSEVFEDGADINVTTLKAAGLVGSAKRPVKLLGDGDLTLKNLTINVDAYSKSAAQAVQAAGGTVIGADAPQAEAKPKKAKAKAAEAKSVEAKNDAPAAQPEVELEAKVEAEGQAPAADSADDAQAEGED